MEVDLNIVNQFKVFKKNIEIFKLNKGAAVLKAAHQDSEL